MMQAAAAQRRGRHVLVLGATGHTGSALMRELLSSPVYTSVTALVRRALDKEQISSTWGVVPDSPAESGSDGDGGDSSSKLHQWVVEDFRQLEKAIKERDAKTEEEEERFDAAFSCLGSSIRQHGKENFVFIDHDVPVTIAKWLAASGGRKPFHFSIITSVQSDPQARAFYLRIKGETEQELSQIEGLSRLSIFRPAGITGREEPFSEMFAKKNYGWPHKCGPALCEFG